MTLYEEYRGFSVKGDYVQGEPKKKDVFICDDTGMSVAAGESSLGKEGIDLFENLTQLTVHGVTRDELGESKVINRHYSSDTHQVDQHGILLMRSPWGEMRKPSQKESIRRQGIRIMSYEGETRRERRKQTSLCSLGRLPPTRPI